MTIDRYNELMFSYYERMMNAKKHRCPRTAAARLRDMARLTSDYTGTAYEECLKAMSEKYEVGAEK